MSQSKIRCHTGPHGPARHARPLAIGAWLPAACGLVLSLGGCTKTDSWFDPSVVGYWEHTPTQVPILRRLSSIEGPEDESVEVSDVTADDLLPDASEYRIGPGDQVQVVLWDVPVPGQPTPFDRLVDHRGVIDIPQIGEVNLTGLTVDQARRLFERLLAEKNLVSHDPLVSMTVANPQQRMYTLMGSVGAPGPHYIPQSDYRLLEAMADAGGIAETVREILVIRQIPLSDSVTGPALAPSSDSSTPASQTPDNERLINIIDEISGDKPPSGGGGSPGALGSSDSAIVYRQPATTPAPGQPEVGLIQKKQPSAPGRPGGDDSWVFVNNQWVQVKAPPAQSQSGGTPSDGLPAPTDLLTQRVIRVPVAELLAGDGRYNIVVRPGDVIRVPNPANGTVYLGGEINRPGAFSMAPGLTLMRVIDAAGGLSAIGIPERVDIIRMTGPERQGMIRVDLRAINEGTQPDIFMKANDRVNIGTSFWAYPLAVARNGFRATYGYGFLLDRNFGQDVFGVPPSSGLFNLNP